MTGEGDLGEFNIILAGRVTKGFPYELGRNVMYLVAHGRRENVFAFVIGLPKPANEFEKTLCGWGDLVIQTRLDDPKYVLASSLVVEELGFGVGYIKGVDWVTKLCVSICEGLESRSSPDLAGLGGFRRRPFRFFHDNSK